MKKQRADDNATVPGPWNQKETQCENVIFLLFLTSLISVFENKALYKKTDQVIFTACPQENAGCKRSSLNNCTTLSLVNLRMSSSSKRPTGQASPLIGCTTFFVKGKAARNCIRICCVLHSLSRRYGELVKSEHRLASAKNSVHWCQQQRVDHRT